MILKDYKYQAEENGEGSTSTGGESTETSPLNEERLGEIIKKGFKESLDSLSQGSVQNTQTVQSTEPKDPWDEVLEPRITKRTQQSDLRSQAAEDKADFYTSDYW